MQVQDWRLKTIDIDGQRLYIPSSDAWTELWKNPTLAYRKLPVPHLLQTKLEAIARYPEITAALGFVFDRVHFYELLRVDGMFYRVFIEAVVCDHCRHQAVISATPAVADIYWGSQDELAAHERGRHLPLQPCFACKKPLSRRPTVWQVNS